MNKRASETAVSEIVLIVASILLFSVLLIYVAKASTSSLYYEEIYAKKIGLAIEDSLPGTVLEFDISIPYQISKTNKLFKSDFESSFKREFFSYNNLDPSVQIKLADTGGFNFRLMSNKTVKTSTVNINDQSQVLVIEVGKSDSN
ncbi:Uncharacterised protein [uncultured archaeon]|nr:Uncharacterised protein [uncultured archaeon]